MRGLKRLGAAFIAAAMSVAPLVGAWIETENNTCVIVSVGRTLVGAWIETQFFSGLCKITTRRTPRGCVD